MIYIGSVLGGPELDLAQFGRVVSTIALPGSHDADVDSEHATEDDPGSLDVVFHLPGSLFKPDYTAARCGSLSHKQRIVQVQVAVPEGMVGSKELRAFLLRSVAEAICLAGQRFRRARIPFPAAEYLAELQRQNGEAD